MKYRKKLNEISVEIDDNTDDYESFGAFRHGKVLTYIIGFKRRQGIFNPCLVFRSDDNGIEKEFPLFFCGLSGNTEEYTCTVETSALCKDDGLFFYTVLYDEYFGFCKSQELQLTVYRRDFSIPDWFGKGIIYHIFPDRFAKSGEIPIGEGRIENSEWYSESIQHAKEKGGCLRNNEFFKGNLKGIENKLGYLKTLGVNCIYLCPIFKSASNHRYDTSDYMKIDELLGDEEDFISLCKNAFKNGIHIILDGVFNHTGDDSVYFDRYNRYRNGAYNNPDSPYRNWYNIYGNGKYECWWNIPILPRVRSDCKEYADFICGHNGVIEKWLKNGCAGWRLDVADELSDSFIENVRRTSKCINSDSVIIGEVWEDASNKISYGKRRRYLRGSELDSVMNYPLRNGIVDFLVNRNNTRLIAILQTICENFPFTVRNSLMNFLGTHDTARIINILSGVQFNDVSQDTLEKLKLTDTQKALSKKLVRLGFALIFTFPGIPCIYYGDEASLEGWSDPFNRYTFPWGREDTELTEWVMLLSSVRCKSEVLVNGEIRINNSEKNIMSFTRFSKSTYVNVYVNTGDSSYSLPCEEFSLLTGERVNSVKMLGCDITVSCDNLS